MITLILERAIPIQNYHCKSLQVFWLGDLNFRLRSREQLDALDTRSEKQKNLTDFVFDQLLTDDELTLERCKGLFRTFRLCIAFHQD